MNFSGAPALLIARSTLRSWHGMLLDEPRTPDATPDFEDNEGNVWYIHDDSDFAHPRTYYERLCAALEGGCVLRARERPLAISGGCNTVAWWPKPCTILTGSEELTNLAALDFVQCGKPSRAGAALASPARPQPRAERPPIVPGGAQALRAPTRRRMRKQAHQRRPLPIRRR